MIFTSRPLIYLLNKMHAAIDSDRCIHDGFMICPSWLGAVDLYRKQKDDNPPASKMGTKMQTWL